MLFLSFDSFSADARHSQQTISGSVSSVTPLLLDNDAGVLCRSCRPNCRKVVIGGTTCEVNKVCSTIQEPVSCKNNWSFEQQGRSK